MNPRIGILGAGITGLAAACRLAEARARGGPSFLILEGAPRPGGWIATRRRGDFLLEDGPDAFLTERPWGMDLVRRLGLEPRLIGTSPGKRQSFIVRRGRLHPTPEGFVVLAPSRLGPVLRTPILSPFGKARAAMDLILPRRREAGDESLGQFVRRRLGKEVLDRLAQPMISAIYGGDPMKLSLQATLPRFRDMEIEHGSLIRALSRRAAADKSGETEAASGARYSLFASFDEGMEVLVEALVKRLPADALVLSTPAREVTRAKSGGYLVRATGLEERFDGLIVALPAHRAAEVLRPLDAGLAMQLSFIHYGSSATVNMAMRQEDVADSLDGFGFVVPATEGMSILGCTFAHRKYARRAPEGFALLRAFHGEQSRLLSDDALIEATRADLSRLLGVTGEPRLAEVARHPSGMPRYGLGHVDLVAGIETLVEAHPGLALAGAGYRGVGIPECIRDGEQAADRLLTRLAGVSA